MEIKENGQLTTDRFGNPDSALLLNKGYASVPSGIYFDPATGGFTFMAWVKFFTVTDWNRIFDFGNGPSADNILLSIYQSQKIISFYSYIGSSKAQSHTSPNEFKLNEWLHIAVSVSGGTATLYQNGVKQVEDSGKFNVIEFLCF